MYKLIASDMDGTFLNSVGKVSNNSAEYIKDLKEFMFVPTTGREVGFIKETLEGLNINYIIACNGAIIYDNKNDEIIYKSIIKESVYKDILEAIKDMTARVEFQFFSGDIMLNNSESLSFINSLEKDVYKMNLYFENETDYHFCANKFEKIDSEFYYIKNPDGSSHSIEIVAKGNSKKTGIKRLAEILKVEEYEIIAIGDSANDIPMFEVAGLSVAMQNAPESIKEVADLVTYKNNDNDGVIDFIEKELLEKASNVE
ncbi:MAG: Cof-type HAD-IIB family hydrolase [Clostridia bacterium]|jgi:HAD superfamily hydrolase (TIGR01484 family)|nr:Cof-type HAD-IIB family hydrolase [Clostridia bacterium]